LINENDFGLKIAGMSYGQASMYGARLIADAYATGYWLGLGDKLSALEAILRRELHREVA
jgi:hypothetical protein